LSNLDEVAALSNDLRDGGR